MKSALEVCMLISIRMRLDSRKQLNANKHPSQLNHIPILNELQQAAHKHHNRFKHGRENHLVLQLLQIYSSPRHSSLTRLVVVLLLSRVTLLVLHGVDFSGNRLQLVRQVVHITYSLWPLRMATGCHVLRARRFVDGLHLVADLITEGNADFVRLGGGKAHRQAKRLVEHVVKVILRLGVG